MQYSLVGDDGLDLDLDEQVGLNQRGHLYHGRRRSHVPEHLPVHASDDFPVSDVDHVDARSDDVPHRGPECLERRHGRAQTLSHLDGRVTQANDVSPFIDRGRP